MYKYTYGSLCLLRKNYWLFAPVLYLLYCYIFTFSYTLSFIFIGDLKECLKSVSSAFEKGK